MSDDDPFKGKVDLVAGGTGFIGCKPRRGLIPLGAVLVCALDHNETALFEQQESQSRPRKRNMRSGGLRRS